MSLIPIDSSGQVSLYSNNKRITCYNPDILDSNFTAKREFPIDPKNDLLPPAFVSPMSNMRMGPHEQTTQHYFSLSTDDIERYQKQKIKTQIKIYEKILGNCYRKIREYVIRNQTYLMYTIPEFMVGFPSYDINKCAYFINKKLRESGYQTKHVASNMIYIFWGFSTKKKIEEKKQYIQLERETDDRLITMNASEDEVPVLNKYTTQKEEQFLFN